MRLTGSSLGGGMRSVANVDIVISIAGASSSRSEIGFTWRF